jgi:adenine/guanine phosphoribosyltransferase-like PRPP-binding protein
MGLIDLVRQAGATLVGCGIAIEKCFQGGRSADPRSGHPRGISRRHRIHERKMGSSSALTEVV